MLSYGYRFIKFYDLQFINTFIRWQTDPLCDGNYPQNFDEVKKTLENRRKLKYGKAPTSGEEIRAEFQKPDVLKDLGMSKHRENGPFFNHLQIDANFTNCIFSSAKAISLVMENIDEKDRFFLMDGTFRITPRGIFQQVLILHIQFGIKV